MGTRVLVVDDSNTMRRFIIKSLQAVGVPSAVEAEDGNEALQVFRQSEFDLVLTDWKMPGKSGLDVVREIRRIDADIPIMMVTTESDRESVVEAIDAGVSDYLVKPFDSDTLRDKLEKYVC